MDVRGCYWYTAKVQINLPSTNITTITTNNITSTMIDLAMTELGLGAYSPSVTFYQVLFQHHHHTTIITVINCIIITIIGLIRRIW